MPQAAALNSQFLEQLRVRPLATVAEYYASCLPSTPAAIEYLKRHRLQCDSLPIGFADRSLGHHIPKKIVKLGKIIRSQLETVGIYRDNGREHFRGMLTVPLQSTSGEVCGLYGVRIDLGNGGAAEQCVGQGIFNAQALQRFSEVIVCERLLDAWALVAAGHQGAICAVNYTLQIADFASIQRVLVCGETLDCEAFSHCEIHRLSVPVGHTIASYAREASSVTDSLGKLIRAADWCQGAAEVTLPVAEISACSNASQPTKQVPQASPVPSSKSPLEVQVSEQETNACIETRRWRIRGWERNLVPGVLKVNLMVYNTLNDRFHVDTLDLYHARSRKCFLAEAAEEIGEIEAVLRGDLGQVLWKLEELQHQALTEKTARQPQVPTLRETERAAALEFLQATDLLSRILADFEACGIVGEQSGKLVGYLAATSRLMDKPLGLIVQSSSAAGKTSLTEAILRFMPEEARFTCSAMTPQSLYYLGQENLQHKILSIAEESGMREGSYQLKLLQSEGNLSLVTTSKEKGSGRTTSERYEVRGPVALMLTTTAPELDAELMNRCLVISVDESAAQTAAIHAQQRFARTPAGLAQQLRASAIIQRQQNAQRLLRPLRILNPYADQLRFMDWQTRHRRDQQKYLTLIESITLLHQYQRDVRLLEIDGQEVECLEVTREDIALAHRLADGALGRSVDELPGATRRLLGELLNWVRAEAARQGIPIAEFRFTRRAAREALHWNTTHLREHLERLVAQEYIVPWGRGQGKLHWYQLLFEGRGFEGERARLGLVDVSGLHTPSSVASTVSMTDHLALRLFPW
jgi:hypothetical protein